MSEEVRKVHMDEASCTYCRPLKSPLNPQLLVFLRKSACFSPVNVPSSEGAGSTSLTPRFCNLLAAGWLPLECVPYLEHTNKSCRVLHMFHRGHPFQWAVTLEQMGGTAMCCYRSILTRCLCQPEADLASSLSSRYWQFHSLRFSKAWGQTVKVISFPALFFLVFQEYLSKSPISCPYSEG